MRGSLSPARLIAAALVTTVVAAGAASSALATTGTSTANGLQVTASLSPDSVSKGQNVTETESVVNVGHSKVNVRLTVIGARPTATPQTVFVTLDPGGSYSQGAVYPAASLKPGTHTLTVAAANRATGAGAQTSASITVN